MKKFDIEIFTTSDAMVDDPRGEIVRALYSIAETLLDEADGPEDMDLHRVKDRNGQDVAIVRVMP